MDTYGLVWRSKIKNIQQIAIYNTEGFCSLYKLISFGRKKNPCYLFMQVFSNKFLRLSDGKYNVIIYRRVVKFKIKTWHV